MAKERGARVILEKRRGYGRAYKTGMSQLTGDIIVTGDGDATYPFDC
jgi:glycosyltransferase involved in cell wall biosynthesis